MFWGDSKKKIKSLAQILGQIAAGDFSQRAHIHSSDEIGMVAHYLNASLDLLEGKIKRLEAEKEQMRAMLNSMAEGVIALDGDTRILSMNPAAEKLFSVTKQESAGKFFLEVIRIHDIAKVVTAILDGGGFTTLFVS